MHRHMLPSSRVALAATLLLSLAALAPWSAIPSSADPGGWLTYQHDNARSGVDPAQPAVTAAAADWSLALDGLVYAQPLVFGNTVIAATQGNSVYSIDATTHVVHWATRLGQPA